MMASPFFGDGEPTHYDDVVGVEVTIDGMLVIADRLHLVDFPLSLGIRPNIPYEEQRKIVWDAGHPRPDRAGDSHRVRRPASRGRGDGRRPEPARPHPRLPLVAS